MRAIFSPRGKCTQTRSRSTHQLLQRLELRVGLRQERLLVLFLAERNQRALLVARAERLGGDLALAREYDFNLCVIGRSVRLAGSEVATRLGCSELDECRNL